MRGELLCCARIAKVPLMHWRVTCAHVSRSCARQKANICSPPMLAKQWPANVADDANGASAAAAVRLFRLVVVFELLSARKSTSWAFKLVSSVTC